MKFLKLYFILMFWICSTSDFFTQIDHDKAHRRYWYYRTRLINDFMQIGTDQGDCIVLAERNYGTTTNDIKAESKIGPDQIDIIKI
jgi:hypothetical protein